MKYVFCKRDYDGAVIYSGTIPDEQAAPAGCWAATETDLGFQSPMAWLEGKVWDDTLGKPRALTEAEQIQRAKQAKRDELETRFAEENRKNFPLRGDEPQDGAVWRFLGVYATNQNDARIVAFKSHKQRLDDRITRLDNLGKGGNNPALTLENIAAIVW